VVNRAQNGGERQPTEKLYKRQKAPDRSKTNRAHGDAKPQDATQYSTYLMPDLPGGGAALFLAGAAHGYCVENKK